tara:strand:- start:440 stop:661 length:222 start_codon:yes stop_codon:yes gene_type:complete
MKAAKNPRNIPDLIRRDSRQFSDDLERVSVANTLVNIRKIETAKKRKRSRSRGKTVKKRKPKRKKRKTRRGRK